MLIEWTPLVCFMSARYFAATRPIRQQVIIFAAIPLS